mgnify:CR=1 FL=1
MRTLKNMIVLLRCLTVKRSEKVIACPRCLSTDVKKVITGVMPVIYICNKCGYRGYLIIELDREMLQGNEAAQRHESRQ